MAGSSRFTLVGVPGARLSARLKLALELEDGTVLRFDSPHLTQDSAYFADAPTVEAPLVKGAHRAIVRASVCAAAEKTCRSLAVARRRFLSWRDRSHGALDARPYRRSGGIFHYFQPEDLIPAEHPLWRLKAWADEALRTQAALVAPLVSRPTFRG